MFKTTYHTIGNFFFLCALFLSPLFSFIYCSKHPSSFSLPSSQCVPLWSKHFLKFMQLACVAVILYSPHMPCPFIIYPSICSLLHTNTSKRIPYPNIDIISWHLFFVFNIKGKSISHFSLCHLFSSGWAVAAANTRQTFPYLKEGFISVTNRLMRYVCFKTNRLLLGFITQRNEQVLDCLLWEVFFQKTRVNTSSCRT